MSYKTKYKKKLKQWYLALTNAALVGAIGVLNTARGYLLTSFSARNRAHRWKAIFKLMLNLNVGPSLVNTQDTCKHLKGGASPSSFSKDYNVIGHTFVDGTMRVWCANGCGFKSTPGDSNWDEAKWMVSQSSNRVSASERTISSIRKSVITVVYQDKI